MHLGELVRIQGTVQENPGYNTGGAMILLPGRQEPYRLFIPRAPGADKANLDSIRKGDTVRGHRNRAAIQPDYSVQRGIRTAGGGHRRHRAHRAAARPYPSP